MMRKLEDCGGRIAHAYYRSYALTYPRHFLEDTMYYVMNVPDDLITVSKPELFKLILGMTYVEED
ncbi:MAG: hypothetical protein JWL92_32 [Candidatus Nomurabacteria bacterium]|nr:hypothetical protein [Candidatus Nomurabacteria bacterium]